MEALRGPRRRERLVIVVGTQKIVSFDTFSIFTGVSIRNMQSPSASPDSFLLSGITLVLKPN